MNTKNKPGAAASPLRVPKAKPKLGLKVPTIAMPHEDLIRAEVFDFPSPDSRTKNSLDSQSSDDNISKDGNSGYPKSADLDSRTLSLGYPKEDYLDSQSQKFGQPSKEDLDSQKESFGHPKTEDLDSNIAKDGFWIAKNSGNLDSNIAKEKSPDSQKIKKTESKGKWEKYEKKRSTASVFIRADAELINEVKHFNVENRLDMREFFELSSRRYMDSFGLPNDADLDSNIALDDRRKMIMFKTKSSIINLFRAYNRILTPNSEWKPKDDVVGVKYSKIDLRIVEIGIITTQTNILENDSDTQVSRFKYYTREIDKMAAFGFAPDTLDVMIQTYRKRWRELTKKDLDLSFLDKEEKFDEK